MTAGESPAAALSIMQQLEGRSRTVGSGPPISEAIRQ
jgi:hypothetical protein